MASKAPIRKFRTIVLTGSIAAITAAGAWYGAGLKIQQEYKQEVNAILEATPAERIAILESSREALVTKKAGLEKKISDLEVGRRGEKLEVRREGQ